MTNYLVKVVKIMLYMINLNLKSWSYPILKYAGNNLYITTQLYSISMCSDDERNDRKSYNPSQPIRTSSSLTSSSFSPASLPVQSNIITSNSNDKIKLIKNLESSSQTRTKSGLVKLEGHRQVLDAIKSGLKPQIVLYTDRAVVNTQATDSQSCSGIRNKGNHNMIASEPSTFITTTVSVHKQLSQVINDLRRNDPSLVSQVTEEVMKSMVDTMSNQGVVAAFIRPKSLKSDTNFLINIYKEKFETVQIPTSIYRTDNTATEDCQSTDSYNIDNINTIDHKDEAEQSLPHPLLVVVLDGIADPGNAGSLIRTAAALRADAIIVVRGCDVWAPKVVRCVIR